MKAVVADLVDDVDATVLVTELACSEPGCPPIETVIAVLADTGNVQYKIHKPVAEVDVDDVRAAVDTPCDRR
ncbi:MAG: hypothetical protein AAGD33_06415 [Actinomycetota bacterium]